MIYKTLPIILIAGLIPAASIQAETRTDHVSSGRASPIPVSLAQFQALNDLEKSATHQWVSDSTASYSPERARQMTDLGAAATQLATPVSVLLFLIMAAPL